MSVTFLISTKNAQNTLEVLFRAKIVYNHICNHMHVYVILTQSGIHDQAGVGFKIPES